jgi:hypothetical protein
MEVSMKSILYGLLLALVPDLAALQAGVSRLSTCAFAVYPLAFEVHARDGSVLICALRRCNGDHWRDPVMKVFIDVAGHVVRPLEFQDQIETKLAGDRQHSIDVDVELKLCSHLMQWLMSAREHGHRLDVSANVDAEV